MSSPILPYLCPSVTLSLYLLFITSSPPLPCLCPSVTLSLYLLFTMSSLPLPVSVHLLPCLCICCSPCLPHPYPVSVSAVHHVFPTPTLSLSICYPVSVAYVYHVSHDLKPHLYVKYFYHLTILSVSCECRVGQYPPFLSRTFRDKFVSINKTIVYMIKKRRQNSENHKFIYVRRIGKEVKERKNRCKKRGFVYIFHNKVIFPPYSSHLTS